MGLAHTLKNVAIYVLAGVEFRFLVQYADLGRLGRPCLAVIFLFFAGHDLHQRRFTGAVHAQHTDFRPRQKCERHILQDFPSPRKGLGQVAHRVNVLI